MMISTMHRSITESERPRVARFQQPVMRFMSCVLARRLAGGSCLASLATLLCLLPATLRSQDYERVAPKTPASTKKPAALPSAPEAEGSDRVIVEQLVGLVFITDESQLQKTPPKVAGVHAKGIELLERPKFTGLMTPYLGTSVSMKSLGVLTSKTVSYYRTHDHPVVRVYAPPQDISTGVIQIVVQEGKVGKIVAEGNRWFDSRLLEGMVRLWRGDVITEKKLLTDVNRLRSNPFREVDLVFKPGETKGDVDIHLKTQDRFPVRFFAGYEDSGSDLTGDERFLAGFNWGNPFGFDHQLNYQFMGEKRFNKFIAHSGSYLIPLPWGDRLTFFGFYQPTKLDTDLLPALDIRGEQWQASTRYNMALTGTKEYSHELAFGFDFKQTKSELINSGVRIFAHTTEIVQWMLGYNSGFRDPWGLTSFVGSLFYSPGDLSQYNDDTDFKTAQETAGLPTATSQFYGANYYYARLTLERETQLPWNFSGILRGTYQISPVSNLLPTEQMGFGGYQSIRGYDERLVSGDEGYIATMELRTPPVSFGDWCGIKNARDQFQFLGFMDYGVAQQHLLAIGQDPNVEMWGVGPGFRYSINPFLSVRADYGFQMKDVIDSGFPSRHGSRWHIGVTVAY